MTVQFTSDVSKEINTFIEENNFSSITVLVDNNTKAHCYPHIKNDIPVHNVIEISSGEKYKTIDTCNIIWKGITDNKTDRKGLLINLGGGVIGDMGGFCAATYKRGMDFINIPTTLLAQVDASVGGKLGVDFLGFKNHIGLFKDPNAVIIDSIFLKTLPENELRSGFAEIIKHSIIASKEQWQYISGQTFSEIDFSELVAKSIKIKQDVVSKDPFESGLRKILNFGHTIGHAIESYYLDTNDALLHGEAVAAGMICESYIAEKLGLLKAAELHEIITYIDKIYNRHKIKGDDSKRIVDLTYQDKKNKGNRILMSLPSEIGHAKYDIEVNQQLVVEALDFYSST